MFDGLPRTFGMRVLQLRLMNKTFSFSDSIALIWVVFGCFWNFSDAAMGGKSSVYPTIKLRFTSSISQHDIPFFGGGIVGNIRSNSIDSPNTQHPLQGPKLD